MLARVLMVVDSAGRPIPGTVSVGFNELSWSFTPGDSWKTGAYAIAIDSSLEDVAGNSVQRPFEVDVFDKIEQVVASPTVRLPFTLSAGLPGREQGEGRPAGR